MTEPISGNLYQFTEMTGKMALPMHQYLLASDPSVMFATGNYAQAEWILPEIHKILGERPLNYLFLSHFESDECGGLFLFKKAFPKLIVICSNFTASELPGFGYKGRVIVGNESRGFDERDVRLRFFRYPVEVHLRDGLLVYEENSKMFYSSDIMTKEMQTRDKMIDGNWKAEVSALDASEVLDGAKREKLKNALLSFSPEHARDMLMSMIGTIEKLGNFPIFHFMSSKPEMESCQAMALVIYTLCDGYTRGILTEEDYPRVKAAIQSELSHAHTEGKSPTHILDLSGAYESARIIAELCGDTAFAAEKKEKRAIWRKAYDPGTGYLIKDAVYYEGTFRNYSFRPHVEMEQRIELAGGKEKFLAMLDDFFAVNYSTDKPFVREIREGYFEAMNNETDMDTPYAYLWCGRPDRLALILDTIRRHQFTDGEGGAPGNVDSGALSSWYVWACLGVYPLTGSEDYLLGSPSVTEATLQMTHGTLHISVERAGESAIVPERVQFNGRDLTEMRVPVREMEQGGELKFFLK